MEPVQQQLQDVFLWLIRSSFHGTILLAIILLIRTVVKKQFRFQMVYWLWLLLLIRLIWPLNLQTTFSIFNLIPQAGQPDRYLTKQAAEELTAPPISLTLSDEQYDSTLQVLKDPVPATSSELNTTTVPDSIEPSLPFTVISKQPSFDVVQVLCYMWLEGMAVLGAYVLFSNFRLWRIVKRRRLVTQQDILDLLEDCKAQLQLQTVVGVVETDKIKTPCLFGYLRPRLLLPVGTLEQLTHDQIRYVFLHELAHLKRHDILTGWLMTAVQILHWFNPAIWYAMTQISADRELACDELTLSTLAEDEPKAYGSTILTFLEKFTTKQRLPGMAGLAESQSLLRRRITMISKFKKRKISFVPLLVVMLLLIATTFTSARTASDRAKMSKEAVLDNLNKNLVLYYSFEDDTDATVFDQSGMDSHGQIMGSLLTELNGKVGKAKAFNGIDNSIVIDDFQLKEFTFSAWVKSSKENAAVNNRGLFLLYNGDKSYSIQGNAQGGVGIYVTGEHEINEYDWKFVPDQWTHIAVTYNGEEVRIYINGELSEVGDVEFDEIVQGTAYIGGSSKWEEDTGFWDGVLDEVAVFDRTLTAKEIKIFRDNPLPVEQTSLKESDSVEYTETLPQIKTERGQVKVIQMPLAENDYTMIVRFDDHGYGGAGWYDVIMDITYVAGTQQTFNISIKAYIDGISDLIIRDNTAYWYNHKWVVPGRHGKNNYPTTINSVQWYPNWPDKQNNPNGPRGEQRSDILNGLPFTLPQQKINVQFESDQADQGNVPQWVKIEESKGPSGYAIKFDGASNFIRVPNHPSLEPQQEMTIEMWAYIDGFQSTNTRLLRKAAHMGAGYLLAADQVGDGRMQIRFDDGRRTIRAGSAKHADYVGAWHHFAGVYAKGYVGFYLDGKFVARHQHDLKKLMHSPVDLYIGHGAPGGSSEHFKGMIDEVRIWNIARTPQQIQDNMNHSVPVDAPDLAAYWKFNEGSGNIAHDSTSNQNHGRLESRSSAQHRSPSIKPSSQKEETVYTVKAGDTLFKIAEEKLDEGMRYKEILDLNPDLTKEADLKVGMNLKMPTGDGGSRGGMPGMGKMMMGNVPFGIPRITNSASLQAVIDLSQSGDTIAIPAGTYDQPIKINRPLILTSKSAIPGQPQGEVIFKVTANEPAILIDTKGKGKVKIEGLNIQWQLASSDKHEMPFAVAVKDTDVLVDNCIFRSLGNPQRSPVAIRSMGFSQMNISDCDFTGFDYVVCYGEGTTGRMEDSFVRNCGHQGVILYRGAEATVRRNIITGSKFHAVRTTGGKLTMRDNLIINNKNRGVYLGNKSGSGIIENNLLIGNATGIDGISACRFKVRNNVILNSEYAAISAIPQAELQIIGNVFSDNPRGVIIQQKENQSDQVRSKIEYNVFWENETDTENCESTKTVSQEPDFIESANGNFKLADPEFEGMGLSNPKVIFDLWNKYQEKIK